MVASTSLTESGSLGGPVLSLSPPPSEPPSLLKSGIPSSSVSSPPLPGPGDAPAEHGQSGTIPANPNTLANVGRDEIRRSG